MWCTFDTNTLPACQSLLAVLLWLSLLWWWWQWWWLDSACKGTCFSLSAWHTLLECSRAVECKSSWEDAFFHVGRNSVQWSKIRLNGSEPCVIWSSRQLFPVRWRLSNIHRSSYCKVMVFIGSTVCDQRISIDAPVPCLTERGTWQCQFRQTETDALCHCHRHHSDSDW